jgi:hypothetical protein
MHTLTPFFVLYLPPDQAVATSTVYLYRSLGNVAGVAIGSAILQNYLKLHLPDVLKGVPNGDEVSFIIPLLHWC